MSADNFIGNGHYHLNKISLFYRADPNNTLSEESEIDLSSAFVQIDLYESIFSQVMTGSVSLIDTFNLNQLLPIYGEERIELSFNTAGNEENPINCNAIVYKVSEDHRLSEHAKGYTIYFISEAAILSQRTFVQRAYRGLCSDVVEDIFKNMLKGSVEKPLSVLKTKGIGNYTLGALKPLEAVSLVANDAYGVGGEHGFLFFEDNKQFNFTALEALYALEPTTEYYYKVRGVFSDVEQRAVETFNSIQSYKNLEENSYLDRVMEGQHGRTTMRFDLLSKNIQEIEYDKERFFDETKSLGNSPYMKPTISSPNDVLQVEYSSGNQFVLKDLVVSRMRKKEVGTIRAEITVSGDSFNRVGQTCLATLPSWHQHRAEIQSIESGKFLITNIHHELTNTTYMQTIMIEKDSYEIS